jgi:hypothetical protein
MKRCITEYYAVLDKAVDIQFQYDGCSVQYIAKIDSGKHESDFGYIRISIESILKKYESITDSAIFTRSKYLVLLGIISFVIDEPVDVFGPLTRKHIVEEGGDKNKQTLISKLSIDGVNCTDYLCEIITKLSDAETYDQHLIFSLLDRWRKARYMEKDSKTSLIYTDEATLAYFHVLELLGDLYSKNYW